MVGVGMTAFGRHADRTLRSLTADAVAAALQDAGATASDVEVVFFGNVGQGAIEGQHAVRGQIALAAAGIEGVPVINVENACASSSTALSLALSQVAHGAVDVALVVGAEKMFVPERERIAAVFDGCWDVAHAEENGASLSGHGAEHDPRSGSGAAERRKASSWKSMPVSLAGTWRPSARRWSRSPPLPPKTTRIRCGIRCRSFATHSAWGRSLAARPVAWPFTVPMCSPVSDGAAALLVCSPQRAQAFRQQSGSENLSSVVSQRTGSRRWTIIAEHVSHLAAVAAYEQAGVDPKDISVAEVHDATSFAEILQTENLMFCDFGEGGRWRKAALRASGGGFP